MRELQHNVVSLLYSIKGTLESHLEQANERRFGSDSERTLHAEKALRIAYTQAQKALLVTRRIQSLAAGCKIEKHDNVFLPLLWEKIQQDLMTSLCVKNIHFIHGIPGNFPKVKCGLEDLYEILSGISRNAIEAMEGKGRLIIRAQVGFVAGRGTLATILISDTGPGIPEETMPCLFKPFFTTKSEGNGNGLGLCVIRELVERNQGEIAATSFVGQGTTFILKLPIAPVEFTELQPGNNGQRKAEGR